ncbi:MAG: hypothetical protein JSR17_09955 [Proteobacteria bacterium]|nr:hypothetical protein [Pseudomonadota bacterium]
MLEYISLLGQYNQAKKQQSIVTHVETMLMNALQDPRFYNSESIKEFLSQFKMDSLSDRKLLAEALNDLANRERGGLIVLYYINSIIENDSFKREDLSNFFALLNTQTIEIVFSKPINGNNLSKIKSCLNIQQQRIDTLYYNALLSRDGTSETYGFFTQNKNLLSETAQRTGELILSNVFKVEDLDEIDLNMYDPYALLKCFFALHRYDYVKKLLSEPLDKTLKSKACLEGFLTKYMHVREPEGLEILLKEDIDLNHPVLLLENGKLRETTLLLFAFEIGGIEVVDRLLKSGKDLNINYSNTVMSYTGYSKSPESALSLSLLPPFSGAFSEQLLDLGAEVNTPPGVILSRALMLPTLQIAHKLVSKGARLEDKELKVKFVTALQTRNLPLIKLCMRLGAEKFLKDDDFSLAFIPNPSGYLCEHLQALYENSQTPTEEEDFLRLFQTIPENVLKTERFMNAVAALVSSPKMQQNKGYLRKLINYLPTSVVLGVFNLLMMSNKLSKELLENTIQSEHLRDEIYYALDRIVNASMIAQIFGEKSSLFSEKAHRTVQAIELLYSSDMPEKEQLECLNMDIDVAKYFEAVCFKNKANMIKEIISRYPELKNNSKVANLAFLSALNFHGDFLASIATLDNLGFSFGQVCNVPGPIENLTPIMRAMETQGRLDLQSALLACRQPLNLDYVAKNVHDHSLENETVLSYLIKSQRSDDAKIIIEKGANVNLPEGKPLRYALSYNMFDVAELLVSKGAVYPIDTLRDDLTIALQQRNYRKIKLLLKLGGDKYISELSPHFADLSVLINLHAILESNEDEALYVKVCETIAKQSLHNIDVFQVYLQLIDSLARSDSKPLVFSQLIKALPRNLIKSYCMSKFDLNDIAFLNQFFDKAPLPSEQMDSLYFEFAGLDIKKADKIFITPNQRVSDKAKKTGQAISAMKGDLSINELNQYITNGADIDSLLVFACANANVKVVSELLTHDISDKVKGDALNAVLRNLSTMDGDAVKDLLLVFDKNKIPLNRPQKIPASRYAPNIEVEVTPLIAICSYPYADIAKILQEVKGDLNVNYVITQGAQAEFQASALSILCNIGKIEDIKQLLQSGANVDIPPGVPLKNAIARGDPAIVELLYQQGARISKEEILSQLQTAIKARDFSHFNVLLHCGGRDYLQNQEIIDLAISQCEGNILKVFLEDKNFLNQHGNSILSHASQRGYADVIETLFNHGLTFSQEELNARMQSALDAHPQVAEVFIKRGAQLSEEKLRESILNDISRMRGGTVLPVDVNRFDKYLALWPNQPFNDDVIVDAALKEDEVYGSAHAYLLLTGNTALRQKEKIFEQACRNKKTSVVRNCISKGYVNHESLQRGLLTALLSENKGTSQFNKVSSELYDAGVRLSATQLSEYILQSYDNLVVDNEKLKNALQYGPGTPFDDFRVFKKLIDNGGYHLNSISVFLAHGVTPELKDKIFKYAYDSANREVIKKLLDSNYQPSADSLGPTLLLFLSAKDYVTANQLKEKGATLTYPEVKNMLLDCIKNQIIQSYGFNRPRHKLINDIEGVKLILSALKDKPITDANLVETAINENKNEALICFVKFGLSEELQRKIYIYALTEGVDLIPILLEHGFKIDELQSQKLFTDSVDQGKYEVALTLLSQGFKPSQQQLEALITKMISLKVENDKIELLLPLIEDEKMKLRLFHACMANKNLNFASVLLDNGLALTKEEIKPLLIQAIQNKDEEQISFLCKTPLPEGSVFDKEITDLIFANPTRVGLRHVVRTPLTPVQLHKAFDFFIRARDWAFFDELYKLNLRPSIDNQRLALYTAINDADKDRVLDLLGKGIDPKTESSKSLYIAVMAKPPNLEIVQALLDGGADPRTNGCRLALVAIDNAYDDDRYFYLNLDIAKNLLMKLNVFDKSALDDVFASFINRQIQFPQFRDFVKDAIRAKLNPGQQLGFDLLDVGAAIKKRENEYAGEDSLLLRARAVFEKVVKPTLQAKFNSCPGTTDMEKVQYIERNIKAFILDNIVENTSFETDNVSSQLREFNLKNKDALLAGNEQALSTMRSLCISVTDNAQIAWRAYDPLAPHDPGWENLLTQQLSTGQVHTTAAASEGAISAKQASEISRTCVAYYFLAINELNKTNFFQQLADIRRAHEHQYDSPSCFPGTIGRIGRMGEGHPLYQLPPLRKEIIELQMTAILLNAFMAMLSKLSVEQCELFMHALQQPRPETADEVVLEKVPYTKEMMALRERFLQELPSREKMKEKINEAFAANKEVPFKVGDELDLNYHLLDICAGTRAQDFRKRLDEHKEKIRLEREKEKKTDQKTTISIAEPPIANYFARCMVPFYSSSNINPEKARKLKKDLKRYLRQYIEFEVMNTGIRKLLPKLSLDIQLELTAAILERAIKGKYTLEDLRTACTQTVQAFKSKGIAISEQEQSALEKYVTTGSALNGISQIQVDNIISKLKEEALPDEPDEFTASAIELVKQITSQYTFTPAAKASP